MRVEQESMICDIGISIGTCTDKMQFAHLSCTHCALWSPVALLSAAWSSVAKPKARQGPLPLELSRADADRKGHLTRAAIRRGRTRRKGRAPILALYTRRTHTSEHFSPIQRRLFGFTATRGTPSGNRPFGAVGPFRIAISCKRTEQVTVRAIHALSTKSTGMLP